MLAKAAADLTVDRRPIAFVNVETFKGLSYPDVLLSVLIDSLRKFKTWFETAATAPASRTSFWKRLFGSTPKRAPLPKGQVQKLLLTLESQIQSLEEELHSPEASRLTEVTERNQEDAGTLKSGVKAGGVGLSSSIHASSTERDSYRTQVTEESRRAKVDFLRRHILDYQALFRGIADASDGDAYLFLDDLYHIRREDQPELIDYFHRIAKGNRLWLKVGTIRHRTDWYRHSDPPIGVKLGDDADEIDLDLTLEKYRLAKQFLTNILQEVALGVGVTQIRTLLAPTAVDRLVLASGGVARDFLGLFRRSINVARERGGGPRGQRIAAQDVNQAAGEYESGKRDELKRDTLEEREQIEDAFEAVKSFCLDRAKANCFLLEKDRTDIGAGLIEELVDLRLLHLVQSRVTIPDRPGRLYVAYMLDLGQYAGERTRRGLDVIPFWQRSQGNERLRRTRLIYDPLVPAERSRA
ncbi:MAG TPA: hypothetical protein VJB57_17220 [Dehalococcoidia bacterium]|nr:hypothetical protein [Dehalococcoidia bacterium]